MSVIYLLFFAVLNLLIFSYLTRKIDFSFKLKIGLIVLLVVIFIIHFLIKTVISNQHFYHLILISLLLFALHFLSKIPIIIMKKLNPKFENHFAYYGFNFLRLYIIYILVIIYQCISLFSLQARVHFNSIVPFI